MNRRTVVVFLLLTALIAPTVAHGGAVPPARPAQTLTLDILELPLTKALATIARAAGVDLVVEGDLSGTVTLHLTHQTFEQAMAVLAQAYRLDVRRIGTGYVVRQLRSGEMVITPPQAQSQESVVHTYRLRYALAAEVAEEIRAVLGAASTRAASQPLVIGQPAQASSASANTAAQPGAGSGGGAGSSPSATPGYTPGQTGSTSAPRPAPSVPSGVAQPSAQREGVAVASDDRTNTVVVTAPFALQVQVQAVISRLDQPQSGPAIITPQQADPPAGEQVLPQTYRYAVHYADPQAMAQVLQSEVPGVSVVTDLRTNALLVTGDLARQRRVAAILRALDTPATQILIQTEIVDLSQTAAKQLGIQWSWQPYTINQLQIGSVTLTPAQASGGSTVQVNTGPTPIVAAISAFVSHGEGKVLADPQVATQDGVQATVNVGQTLYVPITNVTNGIATTTLQTINAGILLQVTPRLNRNGVVTNVINVQSNSISGFSPQGYPEITTRAVQSIMTVRDGETILIGGLISRTTTKAIQKVPLLGDLPLIGELFRYSTINDQYDNIVVVLTPRVLAPGTTAPLGSSGDL